MTTESQYNLPDKLYFRIGEVSDLVEVKPYVLRYWETEFTDIKPTKSKSGQRLYKRRDVELLLKIKELLYNEGFTINGARQRLKEMCRTEAHAHVEEASVTAAVEIKPGTVEEEVLGAPTQADKKFLQKLKGDLEWCLSTIRSA